MKAKIDGITVMIDDHAINNVTEKTVKNMSRECIILSGIKILFFVESTRFSNYIQNSQRGEH